MWRIYYCDYLPHTTFRFLLVQFSVKYRKSPLSIVALYPSVTQRSVSQENAFKRANTCSFFRRTIGSSNSFTLKQFQVLKGVLHPDTKISMFCLFSPSSRRKSILFMYGCDRCVWFKVKKHNIFSMDLRISHVERFKIFFSFSP